LSDGAVTERTVRPLGLFFWGNKWSLTAWCELRHDFRDFRLDRMQAMTARPETFGPEAGKELDDFFKKMESEEHGEW
jgi:predicted DNA-binding transcriptional regulator YafY